MKTVFVVGYGARGGYVLIGITTTKEGAKNLASYSQYTAEITEVPLDQNFNQFIGED